MELTMLEFLADLLNQNDSRAKGYAAGARWLCLREDLKKEYLAKAEKMFSAWKEGELKAERSRN